MQISAASVLENIQKGIISAGYLLFGKQLYWRDRIHAALRKAFGAGAAGMALSEDVIGERREAAQIDGTKARFGNWR